MVRINTSGDIVPKSNNIIFSAQELRNIEVRSSALIWFKYNNPRREKCYNLQVAELQQNYDTQYLRKE